MPYEVNTAEGTGSARAASELANLTMSIECFERTSARARAAARGQMDQVYQAIRGLADAGIALEDDALSSRFSLDSTVRDKVRHFRAHFQLTLRTRLVDRILDISAAIGAVEGVEVQSPTFSITGATEQRLKNRAFEKAVAAAKGRFAWQCGVIGFDPGDFEIVRWSHRVGSRGQQFRKRLTVGDDSVSIDGGEATVQITVSLTYARVQGRAGPGENSREIAEK